MAFFLATSRTVGNTEGKNPTLKPEGSGTPTASAVEKLSHPPCFCKGRF